MPAWANTELSNELRAMGMECRGAGNPECFRACYVTAKQLLDGDVPDAEIEACRTAYAAFKGDQPPPAPEYVREYASLPDVVGVYRGGTRVDARDRDDWKRHCGASALIGDGGVRQQWDVPVGATVRLSSIRYVANPRNTFDKSVNACRAEKVEVVSGS